MLSLIHIFKSRALLGIIGAAIFLMLSQLLIGSMNNFLYPEYFKNAAGISSFTMLSTGCVLLIISPLSVKISSRFGKKESAAAGVLASGIIFLALDFIGYESAAKVQTEAVINGIYTTSTLVPAIGFLIVAFFLWVVYPLNKSKVEYNVQELKKRRNN